MSNKKAQSLSLNTIIIAILVVLVLVVVVTFFLGGFSRIRDTITNVFFPVSSGTDLTVAVQTCEQYCDQARLLPSENLKKQSSYCKSFFNLDYDPKDGEADKDADGNLIRYYCFDRQVTSIGKITSKFVLKIPCEVNLGQERVQLGERCDL